jgi:hypothetical protein
MGTCAVWPALAGGPGIWLPGADGIFRVSDYRAVNLRVVQVRPTPDGRHIPGRVCLGLGIVLITQVAAEPGRLEIAARLIEPTKPNLAEAVRRLGRGVRTLRVPPM